MKSKIWLFLMIFFLVELSFFVWREWNNINDHDFECRARMHTKIIDNACDKISVFDVFLSLHGDGSGYFLVSGSVLCPKKELRSVDGVVGFNYSKSGGYYSLHLGKRSPDLIEIFTELKYDDFKLKITPTNNDNYIVSSPVGTVMMCTEAL